MHYRVEEQVNRYCCCTWPWHLQMNSPGNAYFIEEIRAIALDFMGFGDSDPTPCEYQIIDHAKTVDQLLDSMGIKQRILPPILRAEIAVEWR